jgi:hypothetical protein
LHSLVGSLNPWDLLLVLAISVQATILAYLRQPRWKAFMLSLPVPFTLMALAAARPVDVTNALGLILLLLFTHGVRWLHSRLRVPIIPAIFLAALGYCVLGSLAVPLLPRTDAAFWMTWGLVIALGVYLLLSLPGRSEPDYRTQLPVWIKLPVIAVVVLVLILLRNSLQGFATVFPMVGVIAAYEARYSLWTMGRQIPVIMVSLGVLIATVYVFQGQWGLPLALLAGWMVFILVFGFITVCMWSRAPHPV